MRNKNYLYRAFLLPPLPEHYCFVQDFSQCSVKKHQITGKILLICEKNRKPCNFTGKKYHKSIFLAPPQSKNVIIFYGIFFTVYKQQPFSDGHMLVMYGWISVRVDVIFSLTCNPVCENQAQLSKSINKNN